MNPAGEFWTLAIKQSITAEELFHHERCFKRLVNYESGFTGALAACPQDSGLFITVPKKMKALRGSCLQIPCNFSAKSEQEFDSRETFGVWFKSDHNNRNTKLNAFFHSGRMNNINPMNLIGNLSQKNCTTVFSRLLTTYTDKYFFRIENKPFKATAICDPLQITVRCEFLSILNVIV